MRLLRRGPARSRSTPTTLPAAPDGTPATDDFLDGHAAPTAWSPPIVFVDGRSPTTTTKFPDGSPTTIADFFDTEKFPGKRGDPQGRQDQPRDGADGRRRAGGRGLRHARAPPRASTRAFAKLDTIKDDVVWWEAGAQPPQLLADGEVAMTTA